MTEIALRLSLDWCDVMQIMDHALTKLKYACVSHPHFSVKRAQTAKPALELAPSAALIA
jgi:hypothetical protein